MGRTQDALTFISKHMQQPYREAGLRIGDGDMPAISDLIRRIDTALMERRAA